MSLGGFTMVRNGNLLDYCWRECIQSMLPVCDVVAVSVSPGEDSTEQEVREWADLEPKLSVNIYEWPNPKGNPDWFTDWIQYARMHTPADWVFQLDADEVLSERSYDEIRNFIQTTQPRTGVVTRFNFWRDHKHLIPEGFCCGKKVIRLAPQHLWLASDGEHPQGAEAARLGQATGIQVYHYGFIRKPENFFRKERLLQGFYFDTYDPRLEAAEQYQGNWMEKEGITGWETRLDDFQGEHPTVAKQWLKERGYDA